MAKRKVRIRAARLEPKLNRRSKSQPNRADSQIPALSFERQSSGNSSAVKAESMLRRNGSPQALIAWGARFAVCGLVSRRCSPLWTH